MGNNLRHIRGQAQKELVKKFDAFFNKGYSRWEVWSDWVTLSAIAISNATDSDFEEFFTEPVQQPPKATDTSPEAEPQQSGQPAPYQPAVTQQGGSKLIQCPHCGEWFET